MLTDDLSMYFRYFGGLRPYLRKTLSPDECRRRIERQLACRSDSFLKILDRGIYANRRSPYARLLAHAGIDLPTIASAVRRGGVEGALEMLYDAGVYVSFEEF